MFAMNKQPMLNSALATVARACQVAKAVQKGLEHVKKITKDDRSPVTVADFAVQAVVALELQRLLDRPLIVGEEHAGVLRRDDQRLIRTAVVDAVKDVLSGVTENQVMNAIDACDHDGSGDSYWTLDPIDGTKGFLRGQQYAIALAFIEDGRVTLGVMGCPNLPRDFNKPLDEADADGTMYSATLGGGAYECDLKDIKSPARRIAAAKFSGSGGPIRTCESVEAAHSKQDDTARILEYLKSPAAPVRLDSQCKYAVVARGQADAYLRLPTRADYREKIWDHAAGMLIATEAGATVTDITGKPLDFTHGKQLEENRGIICAVPTLHAKLIDAVEALGIGAAAAH
jgi:3'(2'), 5'-bisphosphate nucleotidase